MADINFAQFEEFLHQKTPYEEWLRTSYIVSPEIISNFYAKVNEKKHIRIVGDYDVDGICSTYILFKGLKSAFPDKDITFRLPHRHAPEGYGITQPIIDEIHELYDDKKEDTLIITVDNGIASERFLNSLQEEGYSVCILDHHTFEPSTGLKVPNVSLVIDPAVESIPNPLEGRNWCAAGLSYMIVKNYIPKELDTDLSTLAGIATVADCMEVKEGNWVLIKKAINNIRKGVAPESIYKILSQMNKNYLDCDEEIFGYYLAPCFNASSRVNDDADRVVKYLLDPTDLEAKALNQVNEERKVSSNQFTEEAIQYVEEHDKKDDWPLWIFVPGVPEGIIGLIAGKISEHYQVPCIAMTTTEAFRGDNMVLKGSARSVGDFNIYKYLIKVDASLTAKHIDLTITEPKVRLKSLKLEKETNPYVKEALQERLELVSKFLQERGVELSDDGLDINIDDYKGFEGFGGHPGAAGLSMTENEFRDCELMQEPRMEIKEDITNFYITPKQIPTILAIIDKYKPFGQGRPKLNFAMDIQISLDGKTPSPYVLEFMGAEKNHISIKPAFHPGVTNQKVDWKIVKFNHTETLSNLLHFEGKINKSTFRGITTPTLNADTCENTYEMERRTRNDYDFLIYPAEPPIIPLDLERGKDIPSMEHPVIKDDKATQEKHEAEVLAQAKVNEQTSMAQKKIIETERLRNQNLQQIQQEGYVR